MAIVTTNDINTGEHGDLRVNFQPLVSIVLPTYNRAQYIIETIESVRQQTYTNWQLLVIDEGSVDNTEELVRHIDDKRIEFHKVRRIDLTTTRSEGVIRAKGELVAFIDSDDLWDNNKLQKQILVFAQYPEADFCLTGGYNFINPGEPLDYFYKRRDGSRLDDLLIAFYNSELAALTPTLIFWKKCLEKIEFTTHVEFIMRLAADLKGVVLYEPLLFRRLHGSNISSEQWEDRDRYGIDLLIKYKNRVPANIAKNALSRAYINSGENYLKYNQKWKALRAFLTSFTYKPFSIIVTRKILKTILHLLIK